MKESKNEKKRDWEFGVVVFVGMRMFSSTHVNAGSLFYNLIFPVISVHEDKYSFLEKKNVCAELP